MLANAAFKLCIGLKVRFPRFRTKSGLSAPDNIADVCKVRGNDSKLPFLQLPFPGWVKMSILVIELQIRTN